MGKINRKLLKISIALMAIAIVALVTLTSVLYENLSTAVIGINISIELVISIALAFVYSVADDKD